MFSKELELSISQAYQEARERRHEFLTVEHMLLALLDNASALSILSACGADVAALEKDLRKVLEDTVPVLKGEDNRDTQPTIGFQRVLQRALYHVQSAGKEEVLGANVLVAIFSEKDSYANYLLNRHDITSPTASAAWTRTRRRPSASPPLLIRGKRPPNAGIPPWSDLRPT